MNSPTTANKITKPRKRAGNIPPAGSLLAENNTWALYLKKYVDDGCVSVKLISKIPQPRKNNYWLHFQKTVPGDSPTEELSRGHDATFLKKFRPEVYSWVISQLMKRDAKQDWPTL